MSRTATVSNLGLDVNYVVDKASIVTIDEGNKISWGMPAKVCQARLDRCCPACGATHWDIQYSGTLLIAGFESDGKDGLCGDCGFAFATSIEQDDPPATDTNTRKPGSKQGKRAVSKRACKKTRIAKSRE